MFLLHASRLYLLISIKKKIESAAGQNSLVIFFFTYCFNCPVVFLTRLFCTFAAYLYILMLLQYFFMHGGWYYCDYGLISDVRAVGTGSYFSLHAAGL